MSAPNGFGPIPDLPGALCAETDPELFFPIKGSANKAAKAICARCDVRADCLTEALTHGDRYGVWGGLSEHERRPLAEKNDATTPNSCHPTTKDLN